MIKRFNRFRSSNRGDSHNSFRRSGRGFSRPSHNQHKARITLDVASFVHKAQSTQTTEYTPTHAFTDFPISSALKTNIDQRGYAKPTPIQDQAIPAILAGRDLIGLANTGTGKTAAFLIPIIDKIYHDRNQKALIIVPTRELAQQIDEQFRQFASGMKIYSTIIIGGARIGRQIYELNRNPHVVIGTPGRLKDLIRQKKLYLEDYSTIVLDEVDLMVDIGFVQDVKYFISLLPKQRQSLFFSATISPKIRDILQSFVTNPVTVSIKKQDTSENVDQDVIKVIDQNKKIDLLHDLLIKEGFDKVLIFGRTKHNVEKLSKELTFRGFKAGSIHGNKSQSQRQRVLQSFKASEIQILLATDVASRGLDIDNVTHVINYDLPDTFEDYIHRIGRTGRGDKKGSAITFV